MVMNEKAKQHLNFTVKLFTQVGSEVPLIVVVISSDFVLLLAVLMIVQRSLRGANPMIKWTSNTLFAPQDYSQAARGLCEVW